MKRFLPILAGLALALASVTATAAGATASLTLLWTLPTQGCSVGITPCDNKPLTGADALTGIDVYLSTSPIADTSTMAPTVSLAAGATSTTATLTVNNGDTIYARVKAHNASDSSDFSGQVSQVIHLDVKPDVATEITIRIVILPAS